MKDKANKTMDNALWRTLWHKNMEIDYKKAKQNGYFYYFASFAVGSISHLVINMLSTQWTYELIFLKRPLIYSWF